MASSIDGSIDEYKKMIFSKQSVIKEVAEES